MTAENKKVIAAIILLALVVSGFIFELNLKKKQRAEFNNLALSIIADGVKVSPKNIENSGVPEHYKIQKSDGGEYRWVQMSPLNDAVLLESPEYPTYEMALQGALSEVEADRQMAEMLREKKWEDVK